MPRLTCLARARSPGRRRPATDVAPMAYRSRKARWSVRFPSTRFDRKDMKPPQPPGRAAPRSAYPWPWKRRNSEIPLPRQAELRASPGCLILNFARRQVSRLQRPVGRNSVERPFAAPEERLVRRGRHGRAPRCCLKVPLIPLSNSLPRKGGYAALAPCARRKWGATGVSSPRLLLAGNASSAGGHSR